ncbi:MAG: glycosyltransferase family 2 protein [Euryarchaeota archaeon]|nr:glycosyltransferase family 2 protein [Euryarchaeota archaeon]
MDWVVSNTEARHCRNGDPADCVSVVIPTRNRPDLLARAIGSVINQTHKALEIWSLTTVRRSMSDLSSGTSGMSGSDITGSTRGEAPRRQGTSESDSRPDATWPFSTMMTSGFRTRSSCSLRT